MNTHQGLAPRLSVQRGFTYLAAMFLVMLLAIALAGAAVVASVERRRDLETELIFDGGQFVRAIDSYRAKSGNVAHPYPTHLEDLLSDSRSITPLHHLRQIYVDPFTGRSEWGLIHDRRGGIVGVHSLGSGRPIKVANLPDFLRAPAVVGSYADWCFIARNGEPAADDANAAPRSGARAVGANPANNAKATGANR